MLAGRDPVTEKEKSLSIGVIGHRRPRIARQPVPATTSAEGEDEREGKGEGGTVRVGEGEGWR